MTERRHRHLAADHAGRLDPDQSGVLAEPEERRLLSGGDADAAILDGFAQDLARVCRSRPGKSPQILGARRAISAGTVSDAVVSHYSVQPVIDIYATNIGRDLGASPPTCSKIIDECDKRSARAARRSSCAARPTTMNSAYTQLYAGLALAIVLIYLLIVVNFQSWLDPFVIVAALPAALAGVTWMLFCDPYDAFRPGADRRDHVHGRGDRQFDPGGELRPRTAGRGAGARSRRRSKPASAVSARC